MLFKTIKDLPAFLEGVIQNTFSIHYTYKHCNCKLILLILLKITSVFYLFSLINYIDKSREFIDTGIFRIIIFCLLREMKMTVICSSKHSFVIKDRDSSHDPILAKFLKNVHFRYYSINYFSFLLWEFLFYKLLFLILNHFNNSYDTNIWYLGSALLSNYFFPCQLHSRVSEHKRYKHFAIKRLIV